MSSKSVPANSAATEEKETLKRRFQTLLALLRRESLDQKIKAQCKKFAKSTLKSIKKVVDQTTSKPYIMVKIVDSWKSMKVDAFIDEHNGLRQLLHLMIAKIKSLFQNQQPQPT